MQTFAGKVTARALWDSGEILLLELFERGATTIDSQPYFPTLKKLALGIHRILPHRKINQVHLHPYDNAKPHTSLPKREALATIGWTVLSQPPYNPALAPSDLHFFEPVWDELRERPLAEDDELKQCD